MSKIYKVCSGNTTIDITVTLTQGDCVFWYSVYQNYYNNTYYRRKHTVTLSQVSPVPFNYNYLIQGNILKNGEQYGITSNVYTEVIPAGVTVHEWYVVCQSEVGQPADGFNNDDYGQPAY